MAQKLTVFASRFKTEQFKTKTKIKTIFIGLKLGEETKTMVFIPHRCG